MKIRQLTQEEHPRASALLRKAFAGSNYETRLFTNLHARQRVLHEWIGIHRGKVVGYICYSNAYRRKEVCGLHLAPLAVTPHMQNQGIGSELLRFSLRQKEIQGKTIFVLGDKGFYTRFGFEACSNPICPFDRNNEHFFSLGSTPDETFTVGYEPEFGK